MEAFVIASSDQARAFKKQPPVEFQGPVSSWPAVHLIDLHKVTEVTQKLPFDWPALGVGQSDRLPGLTLEHALPGLMKTFVEFFRPRYILIKTCRKELGRGGGLAHTAVKKLADLTVMGEFQYDLKIISKHLNTKREPHGDPAATRNLPAADLSSSFPNDFKWEVDVEDLPDFDLYENYLDARVLQIKKARYAFLMEFRCIRAIKTGTGNVITLGLAHHPHAFCQDADMRLAEWANVGHVKISTCADADACLEVVAPRIRGFAKVFKECAIDVLLDPGDGALEETDDGGEDPP